MLIYTPTHKRWKKRHTVRILVYKSKVLNHKQKTMTDYHALVGCKQSTPKGKKLDVCVSS